MHLAKKNHVRSKPLQKNINKICLLSTITPLISVLATSIASSPAVAGSIDAGYADGIVTLACANINATDTSTTWQFSLYPQSPSVFHFSGLIAFDDDLSSAHQIGEFYLGGTRSDVGFVSYSAPDGVAPYKAGMTAEFTALSSNPPFVRTAPLPLLETPCDIPSTNIAFAFDTTGSMSSYIGSVQQTAKNILNTLDTSGMNYRVAVTDYKDFGDYPYSPVLPFSSDKTAITSAIDSLSSNVYGGGDTPESAYSALIQTILGEGIGSWGEYADDRSIILLTDAPPHDPEPYTGYTADDVIAAARFAGVGTNPFARSLAPKETAEKLFDVSVKIQAEADDEPSFFERLYPVRIFTILAGGNTGGSEFYEKIARGTGGKVYYTSSSDDITKALLDITGNITKGNSGTPTATTPENSPVMALLVTGTWMIGMLIFQRKKRGDCTEV